MTCQLKCRPVIIWWRNLDILWGPLRPQSYSMIPITDTLTLSTSWFLDASEAFWAMVTLSELQRSPGALSHGRSLLHSVTTQHASTA